MDRMMGLQEPLDVHTIKALWGVHVMEESKDEKPKVPLLDVGAATDPGLKHTVNADAYFISKDDGLFILADGLGADSSAKRCSESAVLLVYDAMMDMLSRTKKSDFHSVEGREGICDTITDVIEKTNDRLVIFSKGIQRYGRGTTLDLLLLRENHAFISHIGDGRIYGVFKKERSVESYEQLTEDQLVLPYSPDQARVFGGTMRYAFGATFGLGRMYSAPKREIFQVKHIPLRAEGKNFSSLIMMTDGVYRVLTDHQIYHFGAGNYSTDVRGKQHDFTALDFSFRMVEATKNEDLSCQMCMLYEEFGKAFRREEVVGADNATAIVIRLLEAHHGP